MKPHALSSALLVNVLPGLVVGSLALCELPGLVCELHAGVLRTTLTRISAAFVR